MKLIMTCPDSDFDAIVAAVDKAKPGGTVKLSRDALMMLLIDHGKLHREFKPRIGGAI